MGQVCSSLFVLRARYTCDFYVNRLYRWTTKHPLHLTASSSSSSSPSSPLTPLPTSAPLTTASSVTLAPPTESKASFTTAFAMLLYNVCYLAHTQSVEIPLSQAGDALGNLWAVCCSGELGRYVCLSSCRILSDGPCQSFARNDAEFTTPDARLVST